MPLISVPVLWNQTNIFLNNEMYVIEADSTVVGVEQKPSGPFQPGHPNQVPLVDTLRVFNKRLGTLFVNLTLVAYRALIATASIPAGYSLLTEFYDISVATNTITDSVLTNITITAIIVNGIDIDFRGMYAGDTLTFASQLQPADLVKVSFYKN